MCPPEDCDYSKKTCTYGCFNAACKNPDQDKTLCESLAVGGVWMAIGDGTTGKCCGDDPSDEPEPDSGRVLDSATQEHKEWLCTVSDDDVPTITQSKDIRGEVVPIPGMASDALSGGISGSNWFICDSEKNSDGKDDFDHKYDFWNGRRVDDTCRYATGVGFYCGEVAGSDIIEVAASSADSNLISDTVDRSDDGLWYNYYGRLLAGTNEDIPTVSVPLEGLDPGASYVVTIELATDAQGNKFYARVGDAEYKHLGAKYNAWEPVEVGTVTGVAETTVQFYYQGISSFTIRMAVRNIRAVKVGVHYAKQRPVVELDHDYICGTDMAFGEGTLTGERFIECCGSDSECKTGQALQTGDKVEVGGTTWVCADDYRFYDESEVNTDPVVCELLGHIWSGDSCCGDDPGNEQKIWSWRGEQQGCCYASSSQCLVDNAGSPNNNNLPETYFKTEKGPHCIASSQHVLNHLCDAGTWRSRNKGLADKLLKLVEDKDADNYVIFCDDYENALAYYNYYTSGYNDIEDDFLAEGSCYSSSKEYPCFNTFCVAAAPDEGFVVVGGSYNYPKNVSHVEELAGVEEGICGNPGPDDDYEDCGGSGYPTKANLWFSGMEQSFIYSAEKIGKPGGGMFGSVKAKFDAFLAWLTGKHTLAQDVIDKADTYERFYVFHSGEKEVFGREEGVYAEDGYDSLIGVDFINFEGDLCGQLKDQFSGNCDTVGGTSQYISAQETEQPTMFELWQYLTSSLRMS